MACTEYLTVERRLMKKREIYGQNSRPNAIRIDPTPRIQSANNASRNNNNSQQQANSATTETTVATRTASSSSSQENPRTAQANATMTVLSRRTRRINWASMAQLNQSAQYIHDEDDYPSVPTKFLLISQWLIDSGCSNHMTPFKDDLIMDIERSRALVQVANGTVVKAPLNGTALFRFTDIETHQYTDILVENVLYVPGLSRRLFSVTQWTSSGGELSFNGDKCHIAYEDDSVPPTKLHMTLKSTVQSMQ